MQINSLYTNPYTKIYGQISEKNTTTPRLITLGNSQDVLVKQQSSQIAFKGLFGGLFSKKADEDDIDTHEELEKEEAQIVEDVEDEYATQKGGQHEQ